MGLHLLGCGFLVHAWSDGTVDFGVSPLHVTNGESAVQPRRMHVIWLKSARVTAIGLGLCLLPLPLLVHTIFVWRRWTIEHLLDFGMINVGRVFRYKRRKVGFESPYACVVTFLRRRS